MKKILIVLNRFGVGGAERVAVDDINEMLNRNVEVRLLTLQKEKSGNSLASKCRIAPEKWRNIYFKNFLDIHSWIMLIRLVREYKPDVVISHLWHSNTISRIVSKICGIKIHYAFEHNINDSVKTRKMLLVDRVLAHFSTEIIAVSEAVKESLVKNGINSEKIRVIYNGIDLDRYSKDSSIDVREKFGIGSEFVYLFVGRLIEQKGVDILLNAFAKVPNGLLFIVGDGKDKEKLISLAHALEVSSRVRFLGIREDIPDLLSMSNCFVLPSRYEGLGVVILEAMATGRAIIVSDFGPAREIIENERNGLIVPIGDLTALTTAMIRVSLDPVLCSKMANEAKNDSIKFSIQRHVDLLLK